MCPGRCSAAAVLLRLLHLLQVDELVSNCSFVGSSTRRVQKVKSLSKAKTGDVGSCSHLRSGSSPNTDLTGAPYCLCITSIVQVCSIGLLLMWFLLKSI